MYRFRKRFYPRRRYYKRRFGYRKRFKPLVRRVNYLQRAIKNRAPELKWYDCDALSSGMALAYNTAGALTTNKVCLTNIPQGSADQQRIGNEIKIKNISLRFALTINGTSGVCANGAARVIIFKVREWNTYDDSTNMALSNILASSSSTFTAVNSPYTMNITRRGAYKVLYDKIITMGNNRTVSSAGSDVKQSYQKYWRTVLKMGYSPVKYSTSATTNASARFHVYLAIFGTIDSALTTSICAYHSRLKFIDN